MARNTCAKCGGPRESDSPYGSYCKECGKGIQRTNYANRMGKTIAKDAQDVSNFDPVERRAYLLRNTMAPGRCEVCMEPSTEPLQLAYLSATDANRELYIGEPLALICADCRSILSATERLYRRWTRVIRFVQVNNVQWDRMYTD